MKEHVVHNPLEAYKRVEDQARKRAAEILQIYKDSVPQAQWLRLDTDSAVLLNKQELLRLPKAAQAFFQDGNMAHYRTDRVALRGENTTLMDGYYAGGVAGERRSDYFIDITQRYAQQTPELLALLSSSVPEQWKAKLGVWDNLVNVAVAHFHALKAIQLATGVLTKQDVLQAEQMMREMFEGYFLTILGQEVQAAPERVVQSLQQMITNIQQAQPEFRAMGVYDFFRTEREIMCAPALMAAFSWMRDGKMSGIDSVVGPMLGSIDGFEALHFIDRYREMLGFSEYHFPSNYIYILPKLTQIGMSSRSMGERSGVLPLYDQQRNDLDAIAENSGVALIDDTASTLMSLQNLNDFIREQRNHSKTQPLTISIGTRWAVNDVAPAEELGNLGAVGVSPTVRRFRGKYQDIETLETRLRVRQRLDSLRVCTSAAEVMDRLQQAKREGRASAIGFDVFGTLIEHESFDRKKRKTHLKKEWLAKIQEWNHQITTNDFEHITQLTRNVMEANAVKQHGKDAEYKDEEFWEHVLNFFGITDTKQKVSELLQIELEYEKSVQKIISGMYEVVQTAVALFGREKVGVFSNTRLPKSIIVELLSGFDLIRDDMLSADNIFVSSEALVMKPHQKTMQILAQQLVVQTKDLMFIGDSKQDVHAAARSKAVGVQLKLDRTK